MTQTGYYGEVDKYSGRRAVVSLKYTIGASLLCWVLFTNSWFLNCMHTRIKNDNTLNPAVIIWMPATYAHVGICCLYVIRVCTVPTIAIWADLHFLCTWMQAGNTAVFFAAKAKDSANIKYLLEQGGNPSIKNKVRLENIWNNQLEKDFVTAHIHTFDLHSKDAHMNSSYK